MNVLESLQGSQVKETGATACIILTWSRISKCLGKDFLPYMSKAMPYLVECARLELDETVISEYSKNYLLDELDNSLKKGKFREETSCTGEKFLLGIKSMACLILSSFAQILEEDFYPWISQAASIFIPLLKFYIHRNAREYASYAMPILLRSAKLAVDKGTVQGGNESYFKHLSSSMILALGDALYSESKAKVCATILHALTLCLKICGPLINEDQVCRIINEIKHVIAESSRRKGELREREKLEDFDAEEDEWLREEREQEVQVFRNVGGLLISLIKTFKVDFLPSLDELLPYLMPMRDVDKTAEERDVCIRIFDTLAENCGEEALKYYHIYLPLLLDSSDDENPVLRKHALYGIGFCAAHGGSVFKPFVGEALSRINVVVMHFRARESKNELAYDNAVSALGKICQFHRESVDLAQVFPTWLNCLPIKADLNEAKLVHAQLCSMIERSDRELLGPNDQYLPKVVSIFAEVLCSEKDVATEETTNRMVNILRHLQGIIPSAILESALSYLLPQQEMELRSIIAPEEDNKQFNEAAAAAT